MRDIKRHRLPSRKIKVSWYETYSVEDIVNNYVVSLYGDRFITRLNVVITLNCIEIVNHYVV